MFHSHSSPPKTKQNKTWKYGFLQFTEIQNFEKIDSSNWYHPRSIDSIKNGDNWITYLKESIFLTRGARGISINSEFEKKAILLRASRFMGTSIADSFTVKSKWRRLIYNNKRIIMLKSVQGYRVPLKISLILCVFELSPVHPIELLPLEEII